MEPSDEPRSKRNEARNRFLAACSLAGAATASYRSPKTASPDDDCWVDIGRLGSPDAPNVLILSCGLNGEEGYCGSTILTKWLSEGLQSNVPRDVGLVMLHAVLPPSYATGSAAIPARETQRNWSDSVLSAAARRFASYTEKAGLKPSNKPTADDAPKPATAWLRQASSSIVDDLIPHARGVAVLEFHTGLRPYGDIAIASCHAATSDGSERLKSWYGENVETDSAAVLDLFALGFGDRLAELPLTAAHIEFGVYSMQGILQLDARKSSTARHSDMRALFSPQSREWSEHIASEGARLIASALKGLAAT